MEQAMTADRTARLRAIRAWRSFAPGTEKRVQCGACGDVTIYPGVIGWRYRWTGARRTRRSEARCATC